MEAWFEMLDDASRDIKPTKDADENKEEIWDKLTKAVPELKNSEGFERTNVIPLYRKVIKYAAAISIIILSFFGGRFSADTAHANVAIDEAPKDVLYLQGSHGAEEGFPGKEFRVEVNGIIRLANSSLNTKTIFVGDTSFLLQPNHSYYLSGTTESPTFSDASAKRHESLLGINLEGGFSLVKID